MSDRMLKVKACEHTSRTLVFASGEDAPGKSRDTSEQCNTCGAVIHDYRHGGGLRSPNYPIVRESPLLKPFLAVCQQLIEAERALAGRGMSLTPDLDMIRLAKENERLRLDLVELQGELSALRAEVAELRGRIAGLQEALDKARADLSALRKVEEAAVLYVSQCDRQAKAPAGAIACQAAFEAMRRALDARKGET